MRRASTRQTFARPTPQRRRRYVADRRSNRPRVAATVWYRKRTRGAAAARACCVRPRAARAWPGTPMNIANHQAIEAWNTVLFQKFCRYQYVLTEGLKQHGEHALQRHPVREGTRVLDIGSGFGDATRMLARMIGPGGAAVGADCAENFVEVSRRD